ncbi:hypothetical protein PV326_014018 [Microctonus aethiopoides]|nr:hypothetical protein PV326_014018 [Microctonus aethiopoides]
MKAVYIHMIVLVCVTQISMGCFSRCTPSPEDCSFFMNKCGYNEKFQENDDHTFSCRCSPNAYREITTDKCELKYQWLKFEPEWFNDTRLVVFKHMPGYSYAIARFINSKGEKIPRTGEINLDEKVIWPFGEHYQNLITEVLLIESGNTAWIPSSNGTIEDNAIEGGNIGDATTYVCRTSMDGKDIGWMLPSSRSCYLRRNDVNYENYFILIHEM